MRKKIKTIMLVSFLLILVELTGIPVHWKGYAALLAGLVIFVLSYLIYRSLSHSSGTFVDNMPPKAPENLLESHDTHQPHDD